MTGILTHCVRRYKKWPQCEHSMTDGWTALIYSCRLYATHTGRYIRQTWAYNASHLKRLLEALFGWKNASARREVVLLANCDGVGDSGVETVISDSAEEDLHIKQ